MRKLISIYYTNFKHTNIILFNIHFFTLYYSRRQKQQYHFTKSFRVISRLHQSEPRIADTHPHPPTSCSSTLPELIDYAYIRRI